MPIARVNGINTYYEDEGSGTPVLFIHGGFGGAESSLYPKSSAFKGVLPADRFRTIIYERRGGGRSEYVTGHYSLKDLAKDARALLAHLDIPRAVIVGDSLGGIVAQKYALEYPETVDSLLLAETGAKLLDVGKKITATVTATRFLPMKPLFPLIRKRVLEPEYYDPLGPLSEEEIEGRRQHHLDYKVKLRSLPPEDLYRYSMGLLRNYGAFINTDLRQEIGVLSMPIDIMHATGDSVVHFAAGRQLHEALPQAEFHTLEGLGHGLFYYPEGRQLAREIIESRVAQRSHGLATTAAD